MWYRGSNPELDKHPTDRAALQALRNVWELKRFVRERFQPFLLRQGIFVAFGFARSVRREVLSA